jgi:predicted ATPase
VKKRAPTGPLEEGFVRMIELHPRSYIDRDEFPFSLPALRTFERLEFHPRCTIFIGENGSGKSTFLEALAILCGFSPEGGASVHRFRTYDSHTDLHESLRIVRGSERPTDDFFLRAESFYNVASYLDQAAKESGGTPRIGYVHARSHGEGFLDLFKSMRANGLYLLDEPESALSPARQLAFLMRMNDLIQEGSQFIMATHSPILMAYPDAWIYEFTSEGIQRVTYEDTEHYQITRSFLQAPGQYLHHLFNQD